MKTPVIYLFAALIAFSLFFYGSKKELLNEQALMLVTNPPYCLTSEQINIINNSDLNQQLKNFIFERDMKNCK